MSSGGEFIIDSIGANRPKGARIGAVISVTTDSYAMVNVGGAEVPAYITDQVFNVFYPGGIGGGVGGIGAVVTVLPVGETWEIISTRTGSTGGGSALYGPELIPNNGFEFGGTFPDNWDAFWTNGPATTTRDTTPGEPLAGSARALVTLVPTTDPVHSIFLSAAVAVDEGSTYLAAAHPKATASGSGLTVYVGIITAPDAANAGPFGVGATAQTAATVVGPGAAYQYAFGTLTVPAGHHYARLTLTTDANAGASLAVSWDEASLRQRITA